MEGQLDMIQRTKGFFSDCEEQKTIIMVPFVVVGEFLTGFPENEHALIIKSLHDSFIISPYDLQASLIFASLFSKKTKSREINQIKIDHQSTRAELKADSMIVATAIAKKAEILYSHDQALKKFAQNHIQVSEIPRYTDQIGLPLLDKN
uniref:PIN domain n=1 Tax=Candidatus Kentrum sp. TUN TaxID=2126343 RepID=A0A451A3D2_9GAMM|nr:MAG: PIN domain [Candidatus Kentron sp. TUN]VFK69972.1 MAG: PIN domain [Candidatus Kentron sp. TUN]